MNKRNPTPESKQERRNPWIVLGENILWVLIDMGVEKLIEQMFN